MSLHNKAVSLHNKVVLVTGAAKRVGRGIAIRLAREGASVAIHYGGSEREAREVSELCGGAPIFKANLEKVSEIEDLFVRAEFDLGGDGVHLRSPCAARMEQPGRVGKGICDALYPHVKPGHDGVVGC